jgi:alpha-tubulin suppressor-like RCC1 family protein
MKLFNQLTTHVLFFSILISTQLIEAKTLPQDILEVSAGFDHTCVLTKSKVHCWGSNNYGQSGIIRDFQNPRGLESGLYHNCIIDDDGVLG